MGHHEGARPLDRLAGLRRTHAATTVQPEAENVERRIAGGPRLPCCQAEAGRCLPGCRDQTKPLHSPGDLPVGFGDMEARGCRRRELRDGRADVFEVLLEAGQKGLYEGGPAVP